MERISASEIRITLEPTTQYKANYTIKYYPLSTVAYTQKPIFLTTNKTNVVLRDLDPNFSYSISVVAMNGAGRGNYTDEVTVDCKCFVSECSMVLEEGKPVCENHPVPKQTTNSPVVTYIIFATVLFIVVALVLTLVLCIMTMTVLKRKSFSRHSRYIHMCVMIIQCTCVHI